MKKVKTMTALRGDFPYNGENYELNIDTVSRVLTYKMVKNKQWISTGLKILPSKEYVDIHTGEVVGTVRSLGTCVDVCKKLIAGKTTSQAA